MFDSSTSSLHAGIDRLQGEDLAALPEGRLDDDLVELSRAIDRLHAEKLRRLRHWETRGVWALDGSRSPRAALARKTGTTTASAGRDLTLARRLEHAPATREAFAAGAIGTDKARLVAAPLDDNATDLLRDAFADSEEALVAAAKDYSAHHLGWLMRHWAAAADPDGHQHDHNRAYQSRRFSISESFEGTWHSEGFFDAESGAIIKAALDRVADQMYREDRNNHNAPDGDEHRDERRSATQRRADSLVEICASVLAQLGIDPTTTPDDNADVPPQDPTGPTTSDGGRTASSSQEAPTLSVRRGARPTIAIIADLDRLAADPTGVAMLTSPTIALPQRALERNLCDAAVVRVLRKGSSAPLDVGRATRQPPTSLVRALVIRDGGCAFPGCDMPTRWCDAHHVQPWEHGGPTALDNLVLVCRHHHRLCHDYEWAVRIDGCGRARFRPPDGDELAAAPSPLDIARHGTRIARHTHHQHQHQRRRCSEPAA